MSSSATKIHEPRAQGVQIDEESLTIDLVDGRTVIVPLGWFPRLWFGKPDERKVLQVFGDGEFLHWPVLDEDLSVPDIVAGRRSGESQSSLKKWLESRKNHEDRITS